MRKVLIVASSENVKKKRTIPGKKEIIKASKPQLT